MKIHYMFFYYLASIVACTIVAKANDAAYYGSGCNIYPMKETDIELRKEVLEITRDDDWANVTVLFHFYNPRRQSKEVLTGFVTPYPSGISEESRKEMYVKRFKTIINGSNIPFTIHTDSTKGTRYTYYEYVFLFTAKFKPGINVVRHSYRIKCLDYDIPHYALHYTLMTANSWANGKIDDFTLKIRCTKPSIFFVQDSLLPPPTPWIIAGNGKENPNIVSPADSWQNCESLQRTIALQSGALILKAKNFTPKCDLHIGWSEDIFSIFTWAYEDVAGYNGPVFDSINRRFPEEATLEDIHRMKEFIYAIYGYIFPDTATQHFFEKMYWYFPDSTVTLGMFKKGVKSRVDEHSIYQLEELEKLQQKLMNSNQDRLYKQEEDQ